MYTFENLEHRKEGNNNLENSIIRILDSMRMFDIHANLKKHILESLQSTNPVLSTHISSLCELEQESLIPRNLV